MYIFYEIWSKFLIFFVAITLTPGIGVVKGLQGYFWSGLIYVGFMLLLPKIIEFIKLPVNITSQLLIGSMLSVAYFYVMRYLLVGFLLFGSFPPEEGLFQLAFLRGYELNEVWVIWIAGFFTNALMVFDQWLLER